MTKLTENTVQQRLRSCMSDISNVVKINFTNRELQDIGLIRKMTNVEVLSLSVNKISTLSDLQYCKNLKELRLRKNQIRNLNEVCHLKNLPRFQTLWSAKNPCTAEPDYRLTVIKNLPPLQKLDHVEIEAAKKGRNLIRPEECNPNQMNRKIQRTPRSRERESRDSEDHETASCYSVRISPNSQNVCDLCRNQLKSNYSNSRGNCNSNPWTFKDGDRIPSCASSGAEPVSHRRHRYGPMPARTERVSRKPSKNLLSAALSSIGELDYSSLEIINSEIRRKLEDHDNHDTFF